MAAAVPEIMDGSYVSDIRLMEKIILKYWRKHK
jgi:hypothetical protein